jgi:hypothetical protein
LKGSSNSAAEGYLNCGLPLRKLGRGYLIQIHQLTITQIRFFIPSVCYPVVFGPQLGFKVLMLRFIDNFSDILAGKHVLEVGNEVHLQEQFEDSTL